jgi:hypothetical protein
MQLTVKISDEDPNINITEAAFDHFRVTENSTLEINEIANQASPIIFPNPTSDKITIKDLNIGDEIRLHNIQGSPIYRIISTNNLIELDLQSIQNGTYFIVINNKILKVVKQ